MSEQVDLRYPIGKVEDKPFADKEAYSEEIKDAHLSDIKIARDYWNMLF